MFFERIKNSFDQKAIELVVMIVGCIVLFAVTLASCTEGSKRAVNTEGADGRVVLVDSFPKTDSLTREEYINWLKIYKGITFDEQENDKLYMNLIYIPNKLEAAMGLSGDSYDQVKEYENLLEVKSGYHFIRLECRTKQVSASDPATNKKDLLEQIKNNIYIINDDSDTISNPTVELFPSSLISQPSQLLVLVPNKELKRLQVLVSLKQLGLKDLYINIKESHLDSFPEIKF